MESRRLRIDELNGLASRAKSADDEVGSRIPNRFERYDP